MDAQIQLFQQIKQLLPEHLSLVDELSDALGISQDSIYRKKIHQKSNK